MNLQLNTREISTVETLEEEAQEETTPIVDVAVLSTRLVLLGIVMTLDNAARDKFHAYVERTIKTIKAKGNLSETDQQALVTEMERWIER